MKRYLVGLAVLLMQNVCAMRFELSLVSAQEDEKCKLVARYLYKYPTGVRGPDDKKYTRWGHLISNQTIAEKIRRFLSDTESDQKFLSLYVNKYIKRLKNKDAESCLDYIYNAMPHELRRLESTSNEIRSLNPGFKSFEQEQLLKGKIFSKALCDRIAQRYALFNACKFVAIAPQLNPRICSNFINIVYIPYFRSEIYEDGQVDIGFRSKEKIEFEENEIYSEKDSEIAIRMVTKGCLGTGLVFEFNKETLDKLIFFKDDIKELRVLETKEQFSDTLEQLSRLQGQDGINGFIELLIDIKNTTKDIARMYADKVGRPWSALVGS